MKRRLRAVLVALVVLLLLPVAAVPPVLALEEPDRLWLVGERAFRDGLYRLSARALERLAVEHSRDGRAALAVLLAGKAHLLLDAPEAALRAFRRAQAFDPVPGDPQEARFWEGEALFRLRRFPEARAAYDDVLRLNAASAYAPDALYGFAWCEIEMGRPEPAVTAFRDLVATWPEHPLAGPSLFYQARALVELRRFDDALPVLEQFGATHAGHKLAADASYLRAWTRLAVGDHRGGIADLKAFVAAHPDHREADGARDLLVDTMARHGDPDEMLEAYRTLMSRQPVTAQVLADAADVAARLGRTAEQDTARRRLRAEFPNHPLARRAALAQALGAYERSDWREVIGHAQVAARSDDAVVRAEAYLLVGEGELKLRRFEPAAKAFERVVQIPAAEPDVRFRALAGLGLAREEQRSWREALRAYEAVASQSPDETLREWARERAGAVRGQLERPPVEGPAKPATSDGRPKGSS